MYSSTLSGNSTTQNCYQDNFTHQQFDIILQGSLILSQFIWGNGLSKGIMVILTLTIIMNLTIIIFFIINNMIIVIAIFIVIIIISLVIVVIIIIVINIIVIIIFLLFQGP